MKIAVVSGSVFGHATELAVNICQQLERENSFEFEVHHFVAARMEQILNFDAYVWISSTTGLGELPPDFMSLYQELRDNLPSSLRGKPCTIIGLGDSCYDDFCNSSVLLAELIAELGMEQITPILKLDASDFDADPEKQVHKHIRSFILQLYHYSLTDMY